MLRSRFQALVILSLAAAQAFAAACGGPPPEGAGEPPPTATAGDAASDASAGAGAAGPAIDLSAYRLVDLTYPFDAETIYWPTAPSGFELERLAYGPTAAGFFYAANAFCAPEHGGTHLDAPIHFAEGRQTVDELPLERLVAPAVVVDVSEKAAADPDYRLTPEDVAAFEATHGAIPQAAIVLLRTGWGERWGDRLRYLGDDTPGDASDLHFPAYGAEAVRLLVEERRVAALGLDTASLDHGPSTDFPVHQVAAAADVPGLENVAHLEELPPTGAWVIALPMKIAGGSGGPVRIVALVPR
jgi:kynurenine formamidase